MSMPPSKEQKTGCILSAASYDNTGCPPRSSHRTTDSIVDRQVVFNLADKDVHPLVRSAGNPTTSIMKEVEEREALQELGGKEVYQLGGGAAENIYRQPARSCGIVDFLKTTESGYDTSRNLWTELLREDVDETLLREVLTNIINAAVAHFYPSFETGTSRTAVDSHNIPLAHDNGFHFSKPSISVKAAGHSFEMPERPEQSLGLGYTNVATVIDVKLDKQKGTTIDQCSRSAVFLRQMFIQQPNRDFARSLFVTEKQFRLVHFDRSIVYTTPLFDIHKDASLLLQFILGLTSPNERDLGLDTSIKWTIDAQSGRKVSGTVELDHYDEETRSATTLTYDLDMTEAPFVRPGIHGRGTVGWHAHDPLTGEAVLVKDAWHSDAKISECEYLKAAQGIPGIVQLLAFQDGCAQTVHYLPHGSDYPNYHNRFKLRIAVRKYGLPVWYFRSRLELVKALRDALIAHHTLFEKGVFHRDVSMFNLLLGLPDAPEGYRGILIDLDMATRTVGCKSSLPPDPYTGTRMYQSVAILRNWSATPTPPHDYADDLASFFYVLCHIMFSFLKPGVLLERPLETMRQWSHDDIDHAASMKSAFTLSTPEWSLIAPYWGDACLDLLEEFQQVVEKILSRKLTIRRKRNSDAEERIKEYDAVAQDHVNQFEKVKSSFDKAIAALENEGLNAQELEPYPKDFVIPHFQSSVRPTNPPPPVVAAAPIKPTSPGLEEPNALASPNPALTTGKKRPSEDNDDDTPRKRLREVPVEEPPTTTACPSNATCKYRDGPSKGEAGLPLASAIVQIPVSPPPANPKSN